MMVEFPAKKIGWRRGGEVRRKPPSASFANSQEFMASKLVFEIPELTNIICSVINYKEKGHLPLALNTSRFKLYAPLVKTLEISRSPGNPYRIVGDWRLLLLRSAGRVLLPNLERLSFTISSGTMEDQLDWVSIFLSSSLVEINIWKARWPVWVGLSSSARLLRYIARNCPRLQTLSITPGEPSDDAIPGRVDDYGSYTWWYEYVEFSSSAVYIHRQMRSFCNLRSLTSSMAILHPMVFLEISRLPFLESLVLKSSATKGPIYRYPGLSESSFPALRQLELDRVDPHVISHLCRLAPLVRLLEKITIEFPQGANDDIWDFNKDRVNSTLGALSKLSPQLRDFSLNIGPDGGDIEVEPVLIVALSRLPLLRYLNLCDFSTMYQGDLGKLCAAVPLLEELRLPYARYVPEDLYPLAAHLPHLRFLELGDIDVCEDGDVEPPIEFPSSPISRSQTPIRIMCDFYHEPWSIESLARYMYLLWPNATFEPCHFNGRTIPEDVERAAKINDMLAAWRADP
ncbi:hypothetical protein BDV93DRAFT_542341 [Ceratobasidium sp. AG-I]|nr:hypothetical protein BDV93DRAFT_542341 [Ceratobasidium sp. AG-I]